MAKSSILNLFVQIAANNAQFNRTLKESQNTLKSFVNNFEKAAAVVGVGFGVREIGRFVIETSKLAGQAEAVNAQFNKLPASVYIMQELRNVTGDTVSQFDLMKTAIKASNFGIELSKLPKLLEFATLRAQQTGQSIDYLVESIIMGIGRKSPMILDNLGISLLAIREKLKGVGVETATVADFTKIVGDIAEESLGGMAKFSENASTKLDRLSASWTDFKIALGDAANQSGVLGTFVDAMTASLQVWSSESISFGDKLKAFFNTGVSSAQSLSVIYSEMIAKTQVLSNESKKANDNATKQFNELTKSTKDYDSIRKISNDSLNKQLKEYDYRKIAILNKAGDENELNKQAEFIEKQKNVYAKDYLNTIEKLIENQKSSKEEIDPQKALEEATKKWNDYYKKITAGAEVAYKNIASLSREMIAVGLGAAKTGPGMEPLLKLPGISEKGGFEKEGDPFGINKFVKGIGNMKAFGSIGETFDEVAEKMQKVYSKKDLVNQANSEMKESFKRLGAEGIQVAGESLGRFISGETTFKQFGREILRAVAGFMKEFGKQLILIGTGMVLAGDKAGGLRRIAIGTALTLGSGIITGSINKAEKREAELASIAKRDESKGLRRADMIGNNIEITGTLVGSGRDLVAVINSTNYDNKIRRGG